MRLGSPIYVVLWAAALALPVGADQRPTIPQLIEKSRPAAPRFTGRIREVAPRPFEDAVATSDLITVASLRRLDAYLSPDQTELYTDFEIIPVNTIAARALPGPAKPGAQRMILRQWGGTATLNGVTVEIKDEEFPQLPTGVPLLLMLTYNNEAQKYEVFDAIAGAFELRGGRKLKHLATTPLAAYQRFDGVDIEVAVGEIRRLGR